MANIYNRLDIAMLVISKKLVKGFSLTEMSVVMVVVGVIASSAISVAISTDYNSKRDQTEAKMLQIDTALAAYLTINHKLPCPSRGRTPITDSSFGVEVSKDTALAPPMCKNSDFSSGNVYGGVVPVATLQLPNDFMFDGWGNRIDYIVDGRFTLSESTLCPTCNGVNEIYFRNVAAGSINVKDEAGVSRTTPEATAVYVVLSHGPNGHGAFPKQGSTTIARINGFPDGNPYRNPSASADEFTNAKYDNAGNNTDYTPTFVMRNFTRNDDKKADAAARTYFDDQLHYKTKSQIVQAAGGQIFEDVCVIASEILNGKSQDCKDASDPTNCIAFATAVNSACLQ